MSGMPAEKLDEQGQSSSARKTRAKKSGKVMRLVQGGRGRPQAQHELSEDQRQELVLEFRLKARKLGRSILRKWHARMDLQEVDSIVDLSLCEAVKRFDPTKGASFMTFLYYHLKGNLIRAVSAAANANVVPTEEEGLDDQPNSFTAIDVAEALCNHENTLPDEVLFKKQLVDLSHQACARLDELEKEVIYRIYIEGQQLMDIAHSLGYSRCHISRVKKKALETLQSDMTHSLDHAAEAVQETTSEVFENAPDRKVIHRRRPRSKKAQQAQAAKIAVNG